MKKLNQRDQSLDISILRSMKKMRNIKRWSNGKLQILLVRIQNYMVTLKDSFDIYKLNIQFPHKTIIMPLLLHEEIKNA